jgi:N utilization substance protein B
MDVETEKKPEPVYGNRHRSRVLALQTLYACEVGETSDWKTMLQRIADGASIFSSVVKYSRELLEKLFSTSETVDDLIKKQAANWDIRRMAAIDRNILRLAVTELSYFRQVPAKVVIDEAVELAKAFGAEESGKFVNGIIDSIHKNMNTTISGSGKEGLPNGTDTCQK